MLTLVCGDATPVIRRALIHDLSETRGRSGTLLIVPDEVYAANLKRTLALAFGKLDFQPVYSIDQIIEAAGGAEDRLVIEPRERLVILRSIIHQKPARYDLLVGEKSAPHLTIGVLQRIAGSAARAMDRELSARESGDDVASPALRERQLRLLAREYLQRLESGAAIDRRTADRMACSAINRQRFQKLFPGIDRLALVGFDSFDDLALLAARHFRDSLNEILVLLNFDPIQDAERYPHLADTYARLFDLADRTLSESGETRVQPPTPRIRVIRARNRRDETRTVAQYLRHRLEAEIEKKGILEWDDWLLLVPSAEKYQPLLEKELADYGIPVATLPRVRVFRHPVGQLLEKLSRVLSTSYSLSSLRQLLKSPILGGLLSEGKVPVRTLPYMHALDRLRRENILTSEVQRWPAQLHLHRDGVAAKLARALEQHDQKEHLARLEKDLTEITQLKELLELLLNLLAELQKGRSLADWVERLQVLFEDGKRTLFTNADPQAPFWSDDQSLYYNAACAELMTAGQRLAACDNMLGAEPVSFASLVSMLHVAIGGACIEPHTRRREGVEILDRWDGRGRRPRVAILCGLVDGEFPQYAQREASLEEDGGTAPNQQLNLARQRYLFDTYLRSARDEVLLFVPQVEDSAEMLESHFVEELITNREDIEVLNTADFRESCSPCARSGEEAATELARCLQIHLEAAPASPPPKESGIETEAGSPVLRNILWNVVANHERLRPDALGNFDGFLYDTELLTYIRGRIESHVHSVSQLDVLVQCPFRYFTQHVLQLEELEEPEEGIDPRDLGKLAHDILFRFMTEWVQGGRGAIQAAQREEALQLLGCHAETVLSDARPGSFNYDLLRLKLFGSTEKPPGQNGRQTAPLIREFPGLLAAFVDLEIQRAENSNGALLSPSCFELGFGLTNASSREDRSKYSVPEPVELELGKDRIRLRGRADRVDMGQSAFAVIDYKTGAAPTIKDQSEGFRVQIPVYLMAFEQILRDQGRPLEPAGGMFYSLSAQSAEVTGQFFRKRYRAEGGLGPRVRSFDEDTFALAMDLVRWRIADGIKRIRQGRFHVTLAGEKVACGYCGSAGICRKDLSRTERLVALADSAIADEVPS